MAILGGAAFAACSADEAEAGFHAALDLGVNHLDIAPRYGDAEVTVGPFVPAVRDQLFVGCKTQRSDPDGVRAQLDESLQRLGCDQFDLYQAHAVTDLDELERRAGAFEVICAARDAGLTRFAGVTGHDLGAPRAHLEAVKRYDLDTVMFPLYPRVWADPVYRADAEALLAYCADHDIGVQVIKAIAREPWGDTAPTYRSWYRPQTDDSLITRGVRFALSTPGVHGFATVGDLELLPRVLQIAAAFEPMTDEDRESVIRITSEDELIFPLADKFRRD
ncbi:MAG: aldo/keto reductase [Actinomycetota bacterium]|nr:aldo/keto reductase [Actinomycetota bacterium]